MPYRPRAVPIQTRAVPMRNIMKHPTSRQLHAYWDRLRGERAAPERGEIEPGEIRNLLADSFILETDPVRRASTVRLAGTRLCALFGRELRGTSFVDLWAERPQSFTDPRQLIETVAGDTVGVVAGLTGVTVRDETLDLELLLLPLRHRGKTQARILGALSPHCIPSWLGSRPILRLETVSLRVLETAAPEPAAMRTFAEGLPEPANDARPVRFGHLLVHEGGRGNA
ncbi:hypothetical protein CHKEEEPN_4563 [Methylorubrum podarium]|nr:hypothetical protein CHKEEEPN_4563 [Methylorubrum podarium]